MMIKEQLIALPSMIFIFLHLSFTCFVSQKQKYFLGNSVKIPTRSKRKGKMDTCGIWVTNSLNII